MNVAGSWNERIIVNQQAFQCFKEGKPCKAYSYQYCSRNKRSLFVCLLFYENAIHCREALSNVNIVNVSLKYLPVSVQFSRSVMSDSLRPHESQHARPPCPSPTPGVQPDSCPSSQWCHPTISSSVVPSPPAFNLSQHQGLFKGVSSLHQVAIVLEFQLQHQSFQRTPRTGLL